jgi:hypothetical protein
MNTDVSARIFLPIINKSTEWMYALTCINLILKPDFAASTLSKRDPAERSWKKSLVNK